MVIAGADFPKATGGEPEYTQWRGPRGRGVPNVTVQDEVSQALPSDRQPANRLVGCPTASTSAANSAPALGSPSVLIPASASRPVVM